MTREARTVDVSIYLKNDLLSGMNIERVFQKHVVDGRSHIFASQPDDEYHLRHDIAMSTNTSINDVILVGSAKLGFSVKTENFASFDSRYKETNNILYKSDIDIAIINHSYFEKISEEIFHLSNHFDKNWIANNWSINRYYNKIERNLFNNYSKYHTRGWIRPDFLPNSFIENSNWSQPCNIWRKN